MLDAASSLSTRPIQVRDWNFKSANQTLSAMPTNATTLVTDLRHVASFHPQVFASALRAGPRIAVGRFRRQMLKSRSHSLHNHRLANWASVCRFFLGLE